MGKADQMGVRHGDAAPGDRHDDLGHPVLRASFELDPSGGQVMVTRFECRRLLTVAVVLLLHVRIKRDVRRKADGFLGVTTLVDWRRRRVLSVSLWRDLRSVYSMGHVPRHIEAAKMTGPLGVETACGVFCYSGDWQRVMFGSPGASRSPLHDLEPAAGSTPSSKG